MCVEPADLFLDPLYLVINTLLQWLHPLIYLFADEIVPEVQRLTFGGAELQDDVFSFPEEPVGVSEDFMLARLVALSTNDDAGLTQPSWN